MQQQQSVISHIILDPGWVNEDGGYAAEVPVGSRFLNVAYAFGQLFVWLAMPVTKAGEETRMEKRAMYLIPSGNMTRMALAGSVYIGTALIPTLVEGADANSNNPTHTRIVDWHVFYDPTVDASQLGELRPHSVQ